jgi:hypothetical protein
MLVPRGVEPIAQVESVVGKAFKQDSGFFLVRLRRIREPTIV